MPFPGSPDPQERVIKDGPSNEERDFVLQRRDMQAQEGLARSGQCIQTGSEYKIRADFR